jgi:hypothetical protein
VGTVVFHPSDRWVGLLSFKHLAARAVSLPASGLVLPLSSKPAAEKVAEAIGIHPEVVVSEPRPAQPATAKTVGGMVPLEQVAVVVEVVFPDHRGILLSVLLPFLLGRRQLVAAEPSHIPTRPSMDHVDPLVSWVRTSSSLAEAEEPRPTRS